MNQANAISFKNYKNVSFAFLVIFVFLLILLHFLDPSVVFSTGFVSNFALGNFNLLFILCLASLSVSKYFLFKLVQIAPNNSSSKISKWLQFFILFSATTNFLIAVFPTQYGDNISIIGYLHLIFAYLSFSSTAVFLSLFVFFNNKKQINKSIKICVAVLYILCLVSYPFSGSLAPVAERILIFMVVLGIFTNLVLIEEG